MRTRSQTQLRQSRDYLTAFVVLDTNFSLQVTRLCARRAHKICTKRLLRQTTAHSAPRILPPLEPQGRCHQRRVSVLVATHMIRPMHPVCTVYPVLPIHTRARMEMEYVLNASCIPPLATLRLHLGLGTVYAIKVTKPMTQQGGGCRLCEPQPSPVKSAQQIPTRM